MTKREDEFAPWNDPAAQAWLNSMDSFKQMTKLVGATLKLEPRKYPHEIRAAVSMIILLCRDGFWPVEDEDGSQEMDDILSLARRQLSAVKGLFAAQLKFKPELASDDSFRTLLRSMDQEMRILDSRMSDSAIKKVKEPPATWGDFWSP